MKRDRRSALSGHLDRAITRTAAARASTTEWRRDQDAEVARQLECLRAQAPHAQGPDGAHAFDHWLAAPPDDDADPGALRAGSLLGHWRLLRQIGEGGMGQVWLAERSDGLYEAQAAIKLLRLDMPTPTLRARFARERAVLARLDHPAIARLLDAGVQADRPYLVLEYVDGLLLLHHARLHAPRVADRVRLALQIAAAVDHAHSLLVVHRDLKPSNVLVTPQGQVKLLDFGIAGVLGNEAAADDLTRQGGVGMTPGYAAPEQILGQPVSTATDVFALGAVLFELLTGALPFGAWGMSRPAMEHAVLHGEPRRLLQPPDGQPSLPPAVDLAQARGDLEAIVAKALRKDHAQRYQHVGDLIADLTRWQTHRAIGARRHDRVYNLRLWLRRNRVVAASTATVVASLSAGLAVTAWNLHRSSVLEARNERVIASLSELLSSGNPDKRTQRVPTVLDILDRSQDTLDKRFHDDPETHARLLEVLAGAYASIDRPDVALKMMLKLEAIIAARQGSGDLQMVDVRIKVAQLYEQLRLSDKSRDQLMALLPEARRQYGEASSQYGEVLSDAFLANLQTGRLDEAARVLEMSRPLAMALREGDPGRSRYYDNRSVLSAMRGRFAESRELLRHDGRPTDPSAWLGTATTQRCIYAASVRLGDYRGVESGLRALVDRFDAGIGNRANLDSAYTLYEIAHLAGDMGRYDDSLQVYEEIARRFEEGGMDDAAVTLPMRAFVLRAQTRLAALTPQQFRRAAEDLLAQVDARRAQVGYVRLEVWQALTHAALAMDDREIAQRLLRTVRADPSMDATKDMLLEHELSRMEGELARLQGDLLLSRTKLRNYVRGFDSYPDRAIPEVWSGMLDLAYTQVLLHDPDAADTLRQASQLRPAQLPVNNPLDTVASYLAACSQKGEGSPSSRVARTAIAAAQRRAPLGPRAGLGTLGGAFI